VLAEASEQLERIEGDRLLAGDRMGAPAAVGAGLTRAWDIVAGHRYHLRLGLVEAINSKIAVLRAQARGYRDPEYFKLKIFQRCGMPENPWAEIIL